MPVDRHTPQKQEPPMTETTVTAPNGEQFPLPTQQDEAAEFQRLLALVSRA